jgi:CRP-like cAMP-binding protein
MVTIAANAHSRLDDNSGSDLPLFARVIALYGSHSTSRRMAKAAANNPGLTPLGLLDQSPWFDQLEEAARTQIRLAVFERVLAAGETLVRRGERATCWYGVLDGLLKWSCGAADGRSVSLGGLTSGSWFGEGSLLRGEPIDADIVALRHSRVAAVPRDVFEWLYRTQLGFNHFLLRQLNERMHWFMGDFSAHRLLGADAQVARALVGLFHPWLHPGSNHQLGLTQEEIASLAGLSRQRCNQALRRMQAKGLVHIEYGSITVLDLAGLARMSSD